MNELPWWVSVIVAGVAYGSLRWIAPTLMQDNQIMAPIMKSGPTVAGLAALFFLCLAGLSLFRQLLSGVIAKKESPQQKRRRAR